MAVKSNGGVFAAIGNFDGVHRGHQYLLSETIKIAEKAGAAAGAVVFEPHPRRFFRPDDPPFLLTTSAQRANLLQQYGAETVFTLTFDEAMVLLSPEDFVVSVLKGRLDLAGVVTGSEFQFGKDRTGNVEVLQNLCSDVGVEAHRVDPIAMAGATEKIGSSDVRDALQHGEIRKVAELLGRNWSVRGVVQEGQKLGRTIGFPTANLILGDLVEPQYGVYAVVVSVEGDDYKGVANFGRRPTVGAPAPLLEVHLFDFDDELYGKEIIVAFVDFIRIEQKFEGLEALKAQIAVDCGTARQLLDD